MDIVADEDEWAFQSRCEELCNDLFHPKWEYRHGAALGLRAIVTSHGQVLCLSKKMGGKRGRVKIYCCAANRMHTTKYPGECICADCVSAVYVSQGAGKIKSVSDAVIAKAHAAWLEDMALR